MEKENIKIWLDDWREPPHGYVGVKSVDDAKQMIENCERQGLPIILVDCDYDLGMYEVYGGNGMDFLEWLDERGTHYPAEVHSSHPVGSMRMEHFIEAFWP